MRQRVVINSLDVECAFMWRLMLVDAPCKVRAPLFGQAAELPESSYAIHLT